MKKIFLLSLMFGSALFANQDNIQDNIQDNGVNGGVDNQVDKDEIKKSRLIKELCDSCVNMSQMSLTDGKFNCKLNDRFKILDTPIKIKGEDPFFIAQEKIAISALDKLVDLMDCGLRNRSYQGVPIAHYIIKSGSLDLLKCFFERCNIYNLNYTCTSPKARWEEYMYQTDDKGHNIFDALYERASFCDSAKDMLGQKEILRVFYFLMKNLDTNKVLAMLFTKPYRVGTEYRGIARYQRDPNCVRELEYYNFNGYSATYIITELLLRLNTYCSYKGVDKMKVDTMKMRDVLVEMSKDSKVLFDKLAHFIEMSDQSGISDQREQEYIKNLQSGSKAIVDIIKDKNKKIDPLFTLGDDDGLSHGTWADTTLTELIVATGSIEVVNAFIERFGPENCEGLFLGLNHSVFYNVLSRKVCSSKEWDLVFDAVKKCCGFSFDNVLRYKCGLAKYLSYDSWMKNYDLCSLSYMAGGRSRSIKSRIKGLKENEHCSEKYMNSFKGVCDKIYGAVYTKHDRHNQGYIKNDIDVWIRNAGTLLLGKPYRYLMYSNPDNN